MWTKEVTSSISIPAINRRVYRVELYIFILLEIHERNVVHLKEVSLYQNNQLKFVVPVLNESYIPDL